MLNNRKKPNERGWLYTFRRMKFMLAWVVLVILLVSIGEAPISLIATAMQANFSSSSSHTAVNTIAVSQPANEVQPTQPITQPPAYQPTPQDDADVCDSLLLQLDTQITAIQTQIVAVSNLSYYLSVLEERTYEQRQAVVTYNATIVALFGQQFRLGQQSNQLRIERQDTSAINAEILEIAEAISYYTVLMETANNELVTLESRLAELQTTHPLAQICITALEVQLDVLNIERVALL